MSRTRTVLIAAGAAAVVGVGASTVPGLAAGGDDTTTGATTGATTGSTTTPAAPGKDGTTRTDKRGDDRAAYEAALAKRLGIDVTKLKAAETAAQGDVFVANLDQLVTNGRFTKEEAATLKAAAANGTLTDALKKIQRTKLQARLADQVKAGHLTQAQADDILKGFDDGDGRGFGSGPGGFGFGRQGGGGHGQFGHRGGAPFQGKQGQGQPPAGGNGNGAFPAPVPQDGPAA